MTFQFFLRVFASEDLAEKNKTHFYDAFGLLDHDAGVGVPEELGFHSRVNMVELVCLVFDFCPYAWRHGEVCVIIHHMAFATTAGL